MTNTTPPSRWRIAELLIIIWSLLTYALFFSPIPDLDDPTDPSIRLTIRGALACYFMAVAALLLPSSHPRATRVVWTMAWFIYLCHVTLAFDLAFDWSHETAVAHTRNRSGVGEGIYVSHLFTLVWTIDVLWSWISPRGHATRPKWVTLTIHGFMAFMVFNGTVVYETGFIRWAGVIGFTTLAALLARRMRLG